MTNTAYTPGRVMVITAHPDDAEFECAGTVARWVKDGASAAYVLATSGDVGIPHSGMTNGRAAEIRESEALAAAKAVGVDEVTADPNHQFRRNLDDRLRDLATRLRESPELRDQAQSLKADLLEHPATQVAGHHPLPLPRPARQPRAQLPASALPDELSVSAHGTLIDCPYRFFATSGLRLKAREEVKQALEKAEYGTLVHEVLEGRRLRIGSFSLRHVETRPGEWMLLRVEPASR